MILKMKHTLRVISVSSFVLLNVLNISVCVKFSGRGLGEVTGLISEALLYGYAKSDQQARGIHTRQFSRAFVFSDGKRLTVIAIVETCMISQAVHKGVLDNLQKLAESNFSESNVMLLPTHSHSLPGGFHTYWLYQAASRGFVNESYMALVNGITQSIIMAFKDLQESQVFYKTSQLLGASVNRSPYAYYNNPRSEIKLYDHDTDKTLHFIELANRNNVLGVISLFPVHQTSLKNYNHLISSDNMGYASLKTESLLNPNSLPGKGKILAAFGQTASGDSTPNVNGSRCEATDQPCSYRESTCPEGPTNPRFCEGKGPHGDQFFDAEIIGEKLFTKAQELLGQEGNELVGSVDYRFAWVKMSERKVQQDNEARHTCLPALGYSFAAGATDGPGIPPFTQGLLKTISFVEMLTDRIFNKSFEETNCHFPKPILIPTGQMAMPYLWQPEILPLQIIKLGSLVVLGVPAEVTTMAGRRLQNTIRKTLVDNGFPAGTDVIVAGMANSYSSYLTTFEEYQVQRYEGASNIFGPHALEAYIEQFEILALALATNKPIEKGKGPPDLRGKQRNALRTPKTDILPKGRHFGQTLLDVKDFYNQGESAEVTFLSGNPRNHHATGSAYLEILREDEAGTIGLANKTWSVEFNDASWETKMLWNSACQGNNPGMFGDCTFNAQRSNVTIKWNIPKNQRPGDYLIVHSGTAKLSNGTLHRYTGFSKRFKIKQE